MGYPLPVYYAEKIKQIEGVTGVTWVNWFGGIYIERRNFFAKLAVDGASYFPLYPEYIVSEEEKAAFMGDRQGVIVGRKIATKYGWQVGDSIPISGTIYPGNWSFNIRGIYTATFTIGSGLAAAAGALLGPVFLVTPTMGDLASLKAFAIVILGGMGNITGAAIGGFILAFVEEIGAGYISSGYRDAMGFLIIILVLLVKPTGLFARAERIG